MSPRRFAGLSLIFTAFAPLSLLIGAWQNLPRGDLFFFPWVFASFSNLALLFGWRPS